MSTALEDQTNPPNHGEINAPEAIAPKRKSLTRKTVKMPPKKAAAADEAGANGAGAGTNSLMIKDKIPSEGDHRFFLAMIANLVTKPDVNWDGVAETMGLKDVKCTKERWRQITKKYELELQDGAGPTTTPAKGRGRKPAAIKTDVENLDDAGEGATPATPKPKATRGKKTPVKSADLAISDDEETPGEGAPATPNEPNAATPSKTPRGRKPASSIKKRASPGGENEDYAEDGTPPKKKQAARKPRGPNKKTLEAQAAAAAAEVADTTEVTSTTNGDNTNVDTEMKEADEDVKKEEPESSLSPAPPFTPEGGEN